MTGVLDFLATGTVFGLSAGFMPGPLLTLVIAETIRYGGKEGVKVALAPLITDVPIILLSFILLMKLSHSQVVLGVISICGGLFVLHLGYEGLRSQGMRSSGEETVSRSLRKGVIINVLSPHPYLFWLTVGSPLIMKALKQGPLPVLSFLGSFYSFLVGSKILLAVVAGRSRAFLDGRAYVSLLRLLGLLLCFFALLLVRDGLKLIGWWL